MHEQLRVILLRRIQRGTLSVSLLARQTGFGQSHLSNFLHSKRQLSLDALDRVLAAQHMTAADLLPALNPVSMAQPGEEESIVPIVSQQTALFEPHIRPSALVGMLHLQPGMLEAMHTRVAQPRRAWQRFVAIRVSAADAKAMEPVMLYETVAVLDRHYTAMTQYRPDRRNVYAVKRDSQLLVRYVELFAHQLVLRPENPAYPVDVIEVDYDEPLSNVIVGRVALVVNEM